MSDVPLLYLLDGHALAYRAYFALTGGREDVARRWITSSGEPTAAVYGFTSILLRLLEQEEPPYMAVAFDAGHSFRDQIYPEYKATRDKMPSEMRPQMARIRQIVQAFGLPILELEGYEADDVLGSAAHKGVHEHDLNVKIITGDRDLLQLVSDRIIVTLPGRKLSDAEDFTPRRVMEVLGIRPEQVVDYKALVGDKSDNIPGVPGIGPKTAVKLLQKYGDLDNIYAHLDEIKPSIRKKLIEHRHLAYLSRELARIRTDLPIEVPLDAARVGQWDPDAVDALFRELEFRTLVRRWRQWLQSRAAAQTQGSTQRQLSLFDTSPAPAEGVPQVGVPNLQVTVVDTPEALADLQRVLEAAETIAVDTETDSLNKMQARLVGLSLAVDPEHGYYIPVGHRTGRQLPWEQVREALRPALTAGSKGKVGHNLKFDYVILARHGLEMTPLTFDTMLAEWLCDPASRNLGLKNLAWVRLDIQMTDISDLIGKGRGQKGMDEVPIAQVAPYAAADVAVVLRLIPVLQADMERRGVAHLLRELEMPLVPILAHMEMTGVAVDTEQLQRLEAKLRQRLAEIETRIYDAVGHPFNLNSPQQLAQVLYDELGLRPPPGTRKTSSGRYTTAASVLEAMRDQHPVVGWILEHRELSKLLHTYVIALREQIHPETGRIHTTYNQTGTVTGRIVSQNPNLQNIPVRTPLGREVRRAFVAAAGYRWLSVDYSQIELRIVAHISGDENMIAAFRAGQDIHRATAAAIFGVPLDAVTPEQRRLAKAVNFGLIYGMTPYGLAQAVGISQEEARAFVEAYFRRFPKVKEYMERTLRQAYQQGYVETLFGRKRYFPELQNPDISVNARRRAEREAINAPIQGTAADILKKAMIAVDETLRQDDTGARLLLQVHDELDLEVPAEAVAQVAPRVKEAMEGVVQLAVPLVAEVKVGPNWDELEPWPPAAEPGRSRSPSPPSQAASSGGGSGASATT
ncbi:MAG: DNA polymerase I [Chloroflexi bacterium]|nr:DNA polymerase I [Chloroflexota bacterium]